MIPASYLFKDVYRERWGQGFERVRSEPWAPERGGLAATPPRAADLLGPLSGAVPTRR